MTTPGMDRNVQVQLTANVDPFQRGMDAASKSVTTLSNNVVTLAKKIDELWKSLGKKLELFGAGGIASLTAATVAAGHLEEAFRGVRSTAALTGQSVSALTQSTMQLARTIPASNTAIAQLMGQVQDLGVRGTASITKFTEVALRLGAATNTAPGSLFADLLQLTRSMGSNINNIDRYSSALVDLSKTNGVASEQILGFANAIESVAQRAGYTQTQVLGLSTAFARSGADSGPGATAFIKITNDISEAVRTGSSVLDTYATIAGKSTAQFKQMAQQNPAAAFVAVINSIRDSGPKGISILQQLGLDGARTQRAIAGLTSGQANLNQILNESTDAYQKNTALTKSSNAVYSDLSSAMEKFRTALAQITEALGGPFLGVATKFIDALTKVLNVLGAIMDSPVGKIVAGFLAVGSGLSMVAGASVLALLALLKFSAVWRVLSGAVGTNIFKGALDGLRGMPRELDNTTAAMTRLYNGTYRLTGALKGSGMSDGGPSFGRALLGAQGASTFSKGNILGFPMRKLRYEINEMRDTLDPRGGLNSKLFDYRERDDSKVNPVSMNGARVGVQNWLTQHGMDMNSEAATDKAQQANQRLRQIAEERANVYKASLAKLDQIRRADPEGFDALVSGAFPKAKGNITDKHRAAYINNMAVVTADSAEKKLKDSFVQVDEDAAVNPIKRIFTKIKTLSAEMVETMGDGTVKIMDIITTAFAASVTKIVELATRARIALEEVQTGNPGSASAGLAAAAQNLGGAAAAAGSRVSSLMTRKAAAPETMATASSSMSAASRVADMTMLLGYNPRRISPAAGGEDEMIAETAKSRMAALGEKAMGATSGIVSMGASVLGLLGPMAIFGPLVFAAGQMLHSFWMKGAEASEKLGDINAKFANVLGTPYNLPTSKTQAGGGQPTGADLSTTKDFNTKFADQIKFLEQIRRNGGGQGQQLAAAEFMVNQQRDANGGMLTQAAQDNLRALFVRSYGKGAGGRIADQAFAQPVGDPQSQFNALSGLLNAGNRGVSNSGLWGTGILSHGGNAYGAKVAYDQAATNVMQVDASGQRVFPAADLLLQYSKTAGMSTPDANNRMSGLITSLGKKYTDATGDKVNFGPGQGRAETIDGFLKSLEQGTAAQKSYANDLKDLFKKINFDPMTASAKDAQAALDKLAATTDLVIPGSTSGNTAYAQYNRTAYGKAFNGIDFSVDTPETQLKAYRATMSLGGNAQYGSADFYQNQLQALRQGRALQVVRGDQNQVNYANSAISGAQQGLTQQRQLTMSTFAQGNAMAQDITAMSQGPDAKYNIADIQAEASQLNDVHNNELQQLQGFVLQVRQMNRQRVYEEQDHTIQLSHMYRDRKIQQDEAMHSLNESIRSSMYETAQAFGNPGQFVQSQYTQSATSAFTGLQEQNDYLKRSKTAMDTLSKMGLSKDTIRLMGLDDPKNFEQAERFVHDMAADPKLVAQWNASIKNRLDISKGLATDPNNAKFADMKRQFDYTAQQAEKAFTRSLGDLEQSYTIARNREADSLNNLIKDAMTGMGDIVDAAKKTGIKGVQDYAAAIVAQSRVAAEAIQAVYGAAPPGAAPVGAAANRSRAGLTFATGDVAATRGLGAGISNQTSGTNAPNSRYGSVANQKLGMQMAAAYGWGGGAQWDFLQRLWGQESSWNDKAGSKGAAYGIPQGFASVHPDYAAVMGKGPAAQIAWGLSYIRSKYVNPQGAVAHKDATDTNMGADPHVKFNQSGGWYGDGAIFNGRRVIGVGERGPEMVLPLNGSGTTFAAAVVAQTMQRLGISGSAIRGIRTAGYAGPTQATSYHHVDASQNFTGDITVQSQDPNEMARKLADKKRLAALTRPVGGRV